MQNIIRLKGDELKSTKITDDTNSDTGNQSAKWSKIAIPMDGQSDLNLSNMKKDDYAVDCDINAENVSSSSISVILSVTTPDLSNNLGSAEAVKDTFFKISLNKLDLNINEVFGIEIIGLKKNKVWDTTESVWRKSDDTPLIVGGLFLENHIAPYIVNDNVVVRIAQKDSATRFFSYATFNIRISYR